MRSRRTVSRVLEAQVRQSMRMRMIRTKLTYYRDSRRVGYGIGVSMPCTHHGTHAHACQSVSHTFERSNINILYILEIILPHLAGAPQNSACLRMWRRAVVVENK